MQNYYNDPHRMIFVFYIQDASQEKIKCVISYEALQDHFGGDSDLDSAFVANQARIELIASNLLRRARLQNGELLIGTNDIY